MKEITPHWSTNVRPTAPLQRDECPRCGRSTVMLELGHAVCGLCESQMTAGQVMSDWTPPFGTVRPTFLVGGVPVLNVIDHRRPPIASADTFSSNVQLRPCRLAETFPKVLMSGRPGDPPFDWSTGVDPELADT